MYGRSWKILKWFIVLVSIGRFVILSGQVMGLHICLLNKVFFLILVGLGLIVILSVFGKLLHQSFASGYVELHALVCFYDIYGISNSFF